MTIKNINEDTSTQVMPLSIDRSFNQRVFTPWATHSRLYTLLFYKNNIQGPFYARDSAIQLKNSLFFSGDIIKEDESIVGSIFYSRATVRCEGSFVLAYSGVFNDLVNSPRFKIKEFGMNFILKTPHYFAYNKINDATLLINPSLNKSIRANLEI